MKKIILLLYILLLISVVFTCADEDITSPSETPVMTWELATDNTSFGYVYGHTSVVFDDKIWVIGGRALTYDNKIVSTPSVHSTSDGTNWNHISDISTTSGEKQPMAFHCSVVYNNKIWLFGGVHLNNNGEEVSLDTTWSSSDGKIWVKHTTQSSWKKRYAHNCLSFNSKIYLIGGFSSSSDFGYKDDVWSSSDGESWTEKTKSISQYGGENGRFASTYAASVVHNNKIIRAGGEILASDSKSYSYRTVTHSDDGSLFTEYENYFPMYFSAASIVSFNGKIYILGGYGKNTVLSENNYSFRNDIYSSSDNGATWKRSTSTTGGGWSARAFHTSVVFRDKIWVIGGMIVSDKVINFMGDVVWYTSSH